MDKTLKLYVIKNKAQGWDMCDGHVISAYDETDARQLAEQEQYASPFEPTITLIANESLHERGIVLESFIRG